MGTLTEKVARFFSAAVRARGQAYFTGRRVRRLTVDSLGEIEALVQGSQKYRVFIEVKRQPRFWTLHTDCTCPYSDSIGGFCKHIWATLLAVESENRLDKLGLVPTRVELDFMGDDGEEASDLDNEQWADDLTRNLEPALANEVQRALA
jgi:uncharacterized Zn finger protein